jgi:hypothetical protein
MRSLFSRVILSSQGTSSVGPRRWSERWQAFRSNCYYEALYPQPISPASSTGETRRRQMVSCPTCRISFANERMLHQHQKLLDDHPFCDKCDRPFRSFDSLIQHFSDLSDTHAFCGQCDRIFSTFKSLYQHCEALPDHPFCKACSRQFSSLKALEQHYSARDDHPFCNECKRPFDSFGALDQHLKNSPRHDLSPFGFQSWGSNIGSTEGVISIAGVREPEQIRSIDGIAIPRPTILPARLGIDPRPASPQITPTTSPDIRSQPAILSNWSGKGQHVEYERDTDIPLRPVRHLGRGSSGDVYEVICEGVALARKLIYPSKTAKREDIWNEVDIMQKLRHRHIVRLVGSYIQNRVLGILLWPVAVCDLAMFLDGLDGDDWAREYIKNLGLSYSPHDSENFRDPRLFLRRLYGCLANTMEYLHGNKVRHKDIKPNNILLTEDGVFLTDFGISRDLTDLSQSITDGPLRGTYKVSGLHERSVP